jgi:hypothetical protein
MSTSAQTGYFGGFLGTSKVNIYKWVAGSITELGQMACSVSAGADLLFEFVANGSTISLFAQRVSDGNWLVSANTFQVTKVACLSFTDTDITAAGKVGIWVESNSGTAFDIDSFSASDGVSAAPTLTTPTGSATGNTTASAGATTDTASGTMYALPRIGGSAASAATIVATGTSLAISSTGAKSIPLTGLTSGSTYVADICHNSAGGNSNVVTSASFTPSTLAYSGTIGAQSGVQGAAFVWSGSNPSTLFSGGIGTKSYTGTGLSGSGLSVNSSTGVLSGTCGTPGTYTVAIVGTDQSTAGSEIPQTETSNSFTLTITASGDTTRPALGGVVTISSVTSSGATASWSAATDNSGTIAGYDYQVNGGSFTSLGNVLTVNLTGLTASTAYTVNVRARDPSGNVSDPVITGGFTTNSGTPGTFVSAALKRNTGVIAASSSLTWVTFLNPTTGAFVVTKTGLSTNSAGVFSTTDAALTTGTYHAVWLEATGQRGWGVASVA